MVESSDLGGRAELTTDETFAGTDLGAGIAPAVFVGADFVSVVFGCPIAWALDCAAFLLALLGDAGLLAEAPEAFPIPLEAPNVEEALNSMIKIDIYPELQFTFYFLF